MQSYSNWYRDQQGNAVQSGQVAVYNANSSTLATIYEPSADGNSLASKSNPFTTDANGFYAFAAPNGDYSIQLSGNSVATVNIPNINFWDGGTSTGGPMTNPMTALGDMIYGGASPAGTPAVTAGNTSVVKQYLSQTGTGAASAQPVWSKPNASEITNVPAGTIAATDVQSAINEIVSDLAASSGASLVGFIQPGTGPVARTVSTKLQESVSILDFGGVGDNSTDNTAALNAAALYCANTAVSKIVFPKGSYKLYSKPNDFPSGITLVGDSAATSYLKRFYTPASATEGFLSWAPSSATQASGGIRNLGILCANGGNGGALIKLVATATYRPGFMIFEGVKTGADVNETCDYCVYIDGSAFTTLNSNGVRDVSFTNCWFFNATTHSVYINNGVHIFGQGVLVNGGGGSVADIFITGGGVANQTNSGYCFFVGGECGNFTIDNCDTVIFVGAITSASVAATATSVVLSGPITSVSNASTSCAVLSKTASDLLINTNALSIPGNIFTARYTSSSSRGGLYIGSAGEPYFGSNINYNAGDTYSRAVQPPYRFGNPGGNGVYPFNIDVAPAGVAGAAITWVNAFQIDTNANAFLKSKINLASITAPSTNGDIWQDSTQKALGTFQDGIKQMAEGVVFTSTATATVANSVAETSIIGTGVGTKTLPANFFVAGKTVRLHLRGVVSETGTPTLQIKVKYGATVLLDSTALALVAGIPANANWECVADITCRTTGATGTVQCSGNFNYQTASISSAADHHWLPANLATIDTTASSALDVTATWGTASASNTISGVTCFIEVLN